MFAFAVAIGFPDDVPLARRVEVMVQAFPESPTDGIATAATGHAAAAILRWAVVARDRFTAPHWDEERQLLFAGDIRLYNRPELAQILGLPGDTGNLSDLEIARRAYLKWGRDAPKHMVGDFAFVAWDERNRTLFAARDHLGVRPLTYRVVRDGVLVASDVRQHLPLVPRPIENVSPEKILTRFVPPSRRPGRTYFRDIAMLKPGHYLIANTDRHQEVRYWLPPPLPAQPHSYEENCDELLRLFRRSVRDRLESDHPIVAHSSGGFDSSTILAAADEVYRHEAGRPPLVMASALARGYPCDDSGYMDAIAARVQFEGVRWSALDPDPTQTLQPQLGYPGFSRGPAGGRRGDLDLATERGARVLMSGMCGDDMLVAGGIFLDLFRNRWWKSLITETIVRRKPLARGGRLLVKSFLGALPPRLALSTGARMFGRSGPPPSWLGPALRRIYPPPPVEVTLPDVDWRSHVAADLWARITSAQVSGNLSGTVIYGTEHGVEVRLPYSDVRIAEHMLTIPWQQRLPVGHLRRTGRDALGSLLPPEFKTRTMQGPWTMVWANSAYNVLPRISELIEHGPWLSEDFIVRREAQGILRQAIQQGPKQNPNSWLLVLGFSAVESWLRQLFCYTPALEVEPCTKV